MHTFGIIYCTLFLDFGMFQLWYTSCIYWTIKTTNNVEQPKRHDVWLAVCNIMHFPATEASNQIKSIYLLTAAKKKRKRNITAKGTEGQK